MNQAWVAGGLARPYSAVPVLPATGVPGTAAAVPVPLGSDTTRPISVRSFWATPGSSAITVAVALAPAMSVGWCQAPDATAAATLAMCRGVATTSAWPMAALTWATTSLGAGKLDPLEVSGSGSGAPQPKLWAAWVSWSLVSVAAIWT